LLPLLQEAPSSFDSGLGMFFLRMLAACALGAFLGRERSLKQKIAGVRTHLIIAAGAALIAACGASVAAAEHNSDPTRLAGQILSGIGFVGAGAIICKGSITIGVTTAASLFFAAAIGIACGLGLCLHAAVGTVVLRFLIGISQRYIPPHLRRRTSARLSCCPFARSIPRDAFNL
jgi:putative Mg2+ transporter-C (MgtC) family protein